MIRNRYFLTFSLAFTLVLTGIAEAAPKGPVTVAELALYRGADRQRILEEGAKKEGTLTFYTSGIMTQTVRLILDAFKKEYPYIKVEVWATRGEELLMRTIEEYKAKRNAVDVIELTQDGEYMLERNNILQPFYSPNLAYIEDGMTRAAPGGGVFAAAFRCSGKGVGYNTKIMSKEALPIPKTYQDLLNPKLKGRMAITPGMASIEWLGVMIDNFGEEFVKKLAQQDIVVQPVASSALIELIINGEYALSPTIFDSHVINVKAKGAPIDWVALEPVHVNVGYMTLTKHAPHPYAALLFVDFELSKKSGELHKSTGYVSPRKDVFGERNYKKALATTSEARIKRVNEMFNTLFVKR